MILIAAILILLIIVGITVWIAVSDHDEEISEIPQTAKSGPNENGNKEEKPDSKTHVSDK